MYVCVHVCVVCVAGGGGGGGGLGKFAALEATRQAPPPAPQEVLDEIRLNLSFMSDVSHDESMVRVSLPPCHMRRRIHACLSLHVI